MHNIIISIFIIIALFGCSTTRQSLDEARDLIVELERSDALRTARNEELEELYNAERAGNTELKEIINSQKSELNKYIESERKRIESEKRIIEKLSGKFGEGSEIITELIEGYNSIRKIIHQNEETE